MSYTTMKYGLKEEEPEEKKICKIHNYVKILDKVMCTNCGKKAARFARPTESVKPLTPLR